MSTTEEYLDGLLQETMGQKESDAKTAQPDITKEEKNAVPADDNHKMSPDEIAALFAQMQGDPEPAAEPEVDSEPVVAPQSESVEDQEDTTESQQLEPVSEQEPVAEAPKEEKVAVPADDNHKMSPDEIAALFAQMQGDPEPVAEPEPAAEPEVDSEPVIAPQSESVEDQEDTTESQQLEPVSEQEPVAEAPKEEKVAVPADDNHKMSPDEIAALFAQMQGDPEPVAEPEPAAEPEVDSEPVIAPQSESVEDQEDTTESQQSESVAEPVAESETEPEPVGNEEEPAEILQSEAETETESVKNAKESDMSDEQSALLKEIQAEPDDEEESGPGDEVQAGVDTEDQREPAATEEKLPPQEEMEIDLSDPDAMGFLQDIREKEDTKESKNEDDAVNEIEELLRKSDNHEMVDEELNLPGEQDTLLSGLTGEDGLEQSDQDEVEKGDKSAKKKKGLFSFFGKKKKKQEGLEQATDDISDAEVAAEGATEAGEEETEPVADGDVHNLLQNLFGEEGTSAEDFLQQEETVGEQVTEAAGKKEKKESFWKKLGSALFEEDEEEDKQEEQEPEKKKKDKKGKKKKKVTDASDNQGILEELDAEGADGKKGKKKKKDKKPKKEKKAIPKEGTEKEADSKKLPIKMVVRIFILAFSILALLLIVVEIIPSMWTAADARNAFYKKEYRTAFEEMTGKKLSKKDQRLYEKARLVASMQQRYDAYTSYTALQMPVEALDSLLSGYLFWQQEADAITEYDATTETDAVKYQILNTLYDTYQLTEDDVRQINALDDYDYTVRLEELTGSLSHKNSNAQQAGSTAVTGDADTTAPTADSPRDGTQTEPASDAADMTQMQDILPEEEID